MRSNNFVRVLTATVFGAVLALGVGVAHADSYGSAGCGLGSMLFGAKPGLVQVLAATTNGTFWSQTFGITSGTSNCSDTRGGTASTKAFIETNREALAKDVARGTGETISSLSTVARCTNGKAVGPTLQRDFSAIFPSEKASDVQVSEAMIRALKSHKELGCGGLS